MSAIRIYKLNAQGEQVWFYDGILLEKAATWMKIQATFSRPDYITPYHTFRQGDRMVEWFFSDRWFNVFQMHDVDDDNLKGWYCNITRPARLETNAIYAEDLALDVMVYPNGKFILLDEEEFTGLNLDEATQQAAWTAFDTLKSLIQARAEMFSLIRYLP